MKRTLTLMLTMAALCCAFTACGNSDKMDSDSDSATEATEKVTEETSVSETEKPSVYQSEPLLCVKPALPVWLVGLVHHDDFSSIKNAHTQTVVSPACELGVFCYLVLFTPRKPCC